MAGIMHRPGHLSALARRAVQKRDWPTARACAAEILRQDAGSAEGHFLAGLVADAGNRSAEASAAFARALELDAERYDAAVELAHQLARAFRHEEAASLLDRYEPRLANSPRYLNLAGLTWSFMGLHERAWPLHQAASALQPGVPVFEANLATCAVYLGRIEEARALYVGLLRRNPQHQRNHYHLAQLERARDRAHVEQMQAVLESTRLPPERNIFLYYALGKELEDLGEWDEAFRYYRMGGDAASRVADYDVASDVAVIDKVIEVCDETWLSSGPVPAADGGRTPIFIVGLPRTGTTLTERILASHPRVESLGETQWMQRVIRRISGVPGPDDVTPAAIEAAARKDPGRIAEEYLQGVRFRLRDKPYFIEKYPENILYLGFIARAFPQARLLHLRRNPMDACFAMYKQSFFRYAYTLENVGRYYLAYDRLVRHWRALLGRRLVEVAYEALVADQEVETRRLLERLGLEFDPACLEFERNPAASATASSVQVRERIHTRSVQRWKRFEAQLAPLRRQLEAAGIVVEPS
jgi:tetratricopeptide (TPR) repeat protein